jgi:hypothetical protein
MAIIRKAITGLNPNSDYIFTLKPRNVELAATDEEQEVIRVTIPAFDGTPSIITGLQLASNFQTVIFKFDPINDKDLDYFEYQLYDNEDGTGDPINFVQSTSNDPILISGTNTANVFLVSVDNSETGLIKKYWGRVRAVNVSGNASTQWSNLVGTGELELIKDSFIENLTAAKITAGTITGAEITLSGVLSKLKSSNYDSTQGWQIDGQGNATFNTATIRGQFSSGTSPNWFRVDNNGNIWSGGTTFENANFRVGSNGVLRSRFVDLNNSSFTTTISSATYTSLFYDAPLNAFASYQIGPTQLTHTGFFVGTGNINESSIREKVIQFTNGINIESRVRLGTSLHNVAALYAGTNNPFTYGILDVKTFNDTGQQTAYVQIWNGNIALTGAKQFKINHPIYPDKMLVHAAIEGPTLDVVYRGSSELIDGEVTIILPDYFEALTKQENRTIYITPKVSAKNQNVAELGCTEISNGTFKVFEVNQSKNKNQNFDWLVIASRSDHEFETEINKEDAFPPVARDV